MWIPSPQFNNDLAAYAYREWISTAIDRVSELCVSVPLIIREAAGAGIVNDHPLLDLLGPYGRANRFQDSFEFMEAHFKRIDIFGNDVWYWLSSEGGAPDEVYQLDLRYLQMRVIDGNLWYIYNVAGRDIPIEPHRVTHFRRANVVSSGVFWGLSAIEKLRNVVETDRLMTKWNQDFFSVGAPDGILIVDNDEVSSTEAKIIEKEYHEVKGTGGRRLAVIRARPGSAVWNEAGLKSRDVDFESGRLLTRQAAFDALGFHVGAVSEASTEAHARVAESLVRESAWVRHKRSASALNGVLAFWPGAENYRVSYSDVRVTDWDRESKKLESLSRFMTINEIRSQHLDLGPMVNGDVLAEAAEGSAVNVQSASQTG